MAKAATKARTKSSKKTTPKASAKSSRKASTNGVSIIDGDGHVIETNDLWTQRMDKRRWGDWIPRFDEQQVTWFIGGRARGGGMANVQRVLEHTGATLEDLAKITASLSLPGGSDPHERVKVMERDGIDVSVLYPTHALFYGPIDPIEAVRDPEFATDCLRAYNDWVSEFCSAYPDKLFAVGGVTLADIDLACQEAERAVNKLGLRGIFVRPAPYINELPFSHEVYDPFWATIQGLDVPVVFHPGVHVDIPGACRKYRLVHIDENTLITNMLVDPTHGGSGLGQAIGNTCDMMVTMARILMGGVAERFPRLTCLFVESGGGWVPTQLERMDEQVELFWLERKWLKLLPSEYFKRQCYVSFDPGEWNLAASAEFLGSDRILWASDFPHPEYSPDVVNVLRKNISSLPDEDQRRILAQNAIDAYRLPIKAE
jgi:uncharacterized protein